MSGITRRVFIDANVFVTSWTLDVLLTLADYGHFEPVWSTKVIHEAAEALTRIRNSKQADRYLECICEAYPEATVIASEVDLAEIELPDPNDRHVVAGAKKGKCDTIVTYNLKDFPASALYGIGLKATHPDKFLRELAEDDPEGVICALEELVANKKRPPRSMERELEGLRNNGLIEFVAFVECAQRMP